MKALSTPSARRFTPFTFFLPPSLRRALRSAMARRSGEPAVVAHLDVLVDEAPPPGHPRELVEKRRLPHAVQAGDELALPAPPDEQPLQGHVELLDFRRPSGELLGTGTRSRVVRVAHLVHAGTL